MEWFLGGGEDMAAAGGTGAIEGAGLHTAVCISDDDGGSLSVSRWAMDLSTGRFSSDRVGES